MTNSAQNHPTEQQPRAVSKALVPSYRLAPAGPAEPWWRRMARQRMAMLGLGFLAAVLAICVGTLPWTLGGEGVPRYAAGDLNHVLLPPFWVVGEQSVWNERMSRAGSPAYVLGTDRLGTSVLVRLLTGGGISLSIGIAAAAVSVLIGTLYGATAGWKGGKIDAVMMRIVDVLYGLPYVLIVVLLAVAVDAGFERIVNGRVEEAERTRARYVERELAKFTPEQAADAELMNLMKQEAAATYPIEPISTPMRTSINLVTLLVAIGGVSWLTMARVVRGQVLSLKTRPYVDAARAMGAGPVRLFARHLLPGLIGPIVVYATLTVPQAILQESFLSFLGIGVKSPLPSWGNMAADGLAELNPYRSHWWLIVSPCVLLALTLLAMNFVGEGLRVVLTPQNSRHGRGGVE
ncbi:MAG: ABC transporter permease [Planctomycetes bacterium]|nr:ABC transporter permease [Planctomycetota bacterium]